MRITIKDSTPGHIGVIGHDSAIEPIRITLSEAEKAEIAAMPKGGTSTWTIFPEAMPEAEQSKFLEDCATTPVPNADPSAGPSAT